MINFRRRGETPPPEQVSFNAAACLAAISRFFGTRKTARAKRLERERKAAAAAKATAADKTK